MQLAIIREVTDFDFLCSFDELTLDTADARLSTLRQKEYNALFTDKAITAFKSTLKSVVIYFRDKRIHFVSILLGQVCALGKGTRNEDALQNIFLQVSQKT
uniref:Uncharacterized protein n=1 Tax=viral metagenome TaxID=1070528 RepID=A0A6C0CL37_9ZZZZ